MPSPAITSIVAATASSKSTFKFNYAKMSRIQIENINFYLFIYGIKFFNSRQAAIYLNFDISVNADFYVCDAS